MTVSEQDFLKNSIENVDIDNVNIGDTQKTVIAQ